MRKYSEQTPQLTQFLKELLVMHHVGSADMVQRTLELLLPITNPKVFSSPSNLIQKCLYFKSFIKVL